uniref:Conjugal transfer protein n=2 Tax=Vibrionaceae TaxID=641 RepID=A0A0H3ZQB7_VIBSP|nr:hypothetical protein [Vibrio splendidus]AKN40557.1 Component of conjugal plasmid transfer system [Enterovibrio norvegicus]
MKLNLVHIGLLFAFSASTLAADGGVVAQVKESVTGSKQKETLPPLMLDAEQSKDIEAIELGRTDIPMQISSLNAQQESFDKSSATANTIIAPYNPTVTYKLAVGEVLGTTIILPDGEGIESYRLGDNIFWDFQPEGNNTDAELPRIGAVSTTMAGSDTSLTIIGKSGNVYTFYLRSYSWQAKVNPTLKIYINDERLQTKLESEKRRQLAKEKAEEDRKQQIENEKRRRKAENEKNDYLTEAKVTPEDYDFGYKIEGGNDDIAPYYVYDDGIFTYFRFDKKSDKNLNRALPVVYKVIDKSDSPTNSTVIGKRTLRVEGLNNNWTLRLGERYLCIKRIVPLETPASNMNTVITE